MPASELDLLIKGVQKPSRYVGGEWNAVSALTGHDVFHVMLCPLDGYEIGMASRELQWLYRALNDTEGIRAERAFLPALDMVSRLRSRGVELYAVESKESLKTFPLIVLLAEREAQLLNVAEILALSGLEQLAVERDDKAPLIVAAGAAIVNWEPVAALVDAVLLGDPDESLSQLVSLLSTDAKRPRTEVLASMARVPGTYVPSFYDIETRDGEVELRYVGPGPMPELRRLMSRRGPCVVRQVVPHMELDHDGGMVDLERCRDAQEAGEAAIELVLMCGYERVRLLAPPTIDYRVCVATVEAMRRADPSNDIHVILPPLHSGFGECVTASRAAEITAAAEVAFRTGWTSLTLASVLGRQGGDGCGHMLIDVAREVLDLGQQLIGRRPRLRIEIAAFVPRAGTEDERLASIDPAQLRDQMAKMKKQLRKLGVHASSADVDVAVVESVISRSGRDITEALLAANLAGCVYDGREGHVDLGTWDTACLGVGFDSLGKIGAIDASEVMPWAHLGRRGQDLDIPF